MKVWIEEHIHKDGAIFIVYTDCYNDGSGYFKEQKICRAQAYELAQALKYKDIYLKRGYVDGNE